MQQDSLTQAEKISKDLYPHQIEGIAFLLGRRRALLADDMGLGKTRQSVIAMVEAEAEGPYLVICPASVKRNWSREIQLVLPTAEPAIVGPTPLPPNDFQDWVIINYEILGKHLEALLTFEWKGIVFDEAHYLKNHRSQRSRNAAKLVQAIQHEPIVHALTGTPMTNRPRDLFPLLRLSARSSIEICACCGETFASGISKSFSRLDSSSVYGMQILKIVQTLTI